MSKRHRGIWDEMAVLLKVKSEKTWEMNELVSMKGGETQPVHTSTTAGPNESVIACFVLILMQLTKMASSVQTPHGERKCSGGKSISPSESRKRREVRPFIKLSFPNTPSTFSCWLMSPLQSQNMEHKKMWFVQRSPRASGRWYPPRITRKSTRHTQMSTSGWDR